MLASVSDAANIKICVAVSAPTAPNRPSECPAPPRRPLLCADLVCRGIWTKTPIAALHSEETSLTRLGVRVRRRPTGDVEQALQLVLGQRSALVSAVCFRVGFGYGQERIVDEPRGLPAPVTKADVRFAVAIASARRHSLAGPSVQPVDQRRRVQIGENMKTTFARHTVEPALVSLVSYRRQPLAVM